MTGFGRTGFFLLKVGYIARYPLLVEGTIGGCLPLAVTLAEDIYRAFYSEISIRLFHGHSYTGNPLACKTGLASTALRTKP